MNQINKFVVIMVCKMGVGGWVGVGPVHHGAFVEVR